MPLPSPGQQPLYHGTFDCAKKTIAADGVLGLYKGMGAPIVGVAPIFAICFFGYNLGKKLVAQNPEHLKQVKLFLIICNSSRRHEILLAGMFSGIFTTAIMAPGERIKVLLQVYMMIGCT